MGQALAGVKIADLTWYIAERYCTELLADYGAEVMKIGKPGEGDLSRRVGPFPGTVPLALEVPQNTAIPGVKNEKSLIARLTSGILLKANDIHLGNIPSPALAEGYPGVLSEEAVGKPLPS